MSGADVLSSKKKLHWGGRGGGGGCILPPPHLYVRGLKGLMIRVLILIEEIFYSLETMKVAVIVIVALLSCFQASRVVIPTQLFPAKDVSFSIWVCVGDETGNSGEIRPLTLP